MREDEEESGEEFERGRDGGINIQRETNIEGDREGERGREREGEVGV